MFDSTHHFPSTFPDDFPIRIIVLSDEQPAGCSVTGNSINAHQVVAASSPARDMTSVHRDVTCRSQLLHEMEARRLIHRSW